MPTTQPPNLDRALGADVKRLLLTIVIVAVVGVGLVWLNQRFGLSGRFLPIVLKSSEGKPMVTSAPAPSPLGP